MHKTPPSTLKANWMQRPPNPMNATLPNSLTENKTPSSNMSDILRTERIPITHANRVISRPAVLSVIGAITLPPRLRIQRAIGALRHIIDAQHIGVEKVAGVVGAVGTRVAVIVGGVGLAGGGAEGDVVGAGEVLDAHVGAGGVDGAAEFDGAGEVGLGGGWGVFDVAWGGKGGSADRSWVEEVGLGEAYRLSR